MNPECAGNTEPQLTRKASLAALATILTTIGLTSLGNQAAEASNKFKVTKVSNLPVGAIKKFKVSNKNVILYQPSAGVYRAFNAKCPHQGVQIGAGLVQGELYCGGHGAYFNPDTGVKTWGAGSKNLTKYKVTKSGGYLYVSI